MLAMLSTSGRGETSSASPHLPTPTAHRARGRCLFLPRGAASQPQGYLFPVWPSLGPSPDSPWEDGPGGAVATAPWARLLTRARRQNNIGVYFLLKAQGRVTGLMYSGAASGSIQGAPVWALEQEKLAAAWRVTAPVGSGGQRPGEQILE